jgi:hypothetical protein
MAAAEDPDDPEVVEERRAALTPEGFAEYTENKKRQGESEEEEDKEGEEMEA